MTRSKCTLDPSRTASDLDTQTMFQRIHFCRGMLNMHGFLTEAENAKITDRIAEWCNRMDEEKHGH